MVELRNLGSSGLKTPKLVLGGNVFGWNAIGQSGFDLLDRFIAAGGTMIDTADVYSLWIPGHKGGESETYLGEWLRKRGRRDDVLIVSKVGLLPGEGGEGLKPARIAAAIDASLQRLGTDYVDLYFAHRDDPNTPLADTLEAFAKLIEAGKVRAIGASNYSAARLGEALDISATNGLPAFTVVQPEYSMVRPEGFEGDLQALCIEKNLGVVPYLALANGFLSGKYRSEADLGKSPRGGRIKAYLNDRGFALLAALDEVAAETGATLPQVALAWTAAQPGITAPIASATTLAQIEDLIGCMTLDLSAGQRARIDAAVRS